ncbi:MAG: dihydroneopterin aldolase [Magnetococcales bacterium]|nr:dihydroneopterin aldolase [Magnetococcales bacterium]MBF0322895.1 dihydroneopterin aldolase [Magnetococcales bacterium]
MSHCSAPSHNDTITIQGLHLRCTIGIEAWERKTRQDILLHITLSTDLSRAGRSDQIADTVNYKTLTKRIIALVEGSSFNLVEALAETLADLCLEEPLVELVRIELEKPGALRFARTVGVCIERKKR